MGSFYYFWLSLFSLNVSKHLNINGKQKLKEFTSFPVKRVCFEVVVHCPKYLILD